jgi:hypothetical protein
MAEPVEKLSARDLWPIAKKLPREEQLALAGLLLRGADTRSDADAYAADPPDPEEFAANDAALAWEGEGWEEFYAKG